MPTEGLPWERRKRMVTNSPPPGPALPWAGVEGASLLRNYQWCLRETTSPRKPLEGP